MLQFGKPPYLECSSKGDKRFSAFYARIRFRNNRTIEDLYQGRKLIEIDGVAVQGLSIKEAKGKPCLNYDDASRFYSQLWDEYISENLDLLEVVKLYNGFSDIFGQVGHVCQAGEIYRIRNAMGASE